MKQLVVILGLMAMLGSCIVPESIVVPYEVMPISAEPETPISSNGAFYALPRQRVNVDIVVKKQEFIKGPYAEFAEKLLGLKNVSKENHSVYSIENVSVAQESEIDPKQIYFVQFNDSKLAVEYDNNLIISCVNTSKRTSSEQSKKGAKQQILLNANPNAYSPLIPTSNFVERLDTVVSDYEMDTVVIQRYEVRTIKTEKTPLQKAEEIVENINKIRDDRDKLLTGFQEVNYEAEAIKFMADEFNRLEDAYIRLFTGTTKTAYKTVHFEFLPENKDSLTVELVKFSTNYGLNSNASDSKSITLDITLNEDYFAGIRNFSKHIELSQKGFYYTIPNQALVKVTIGEHLLFSKTMPFSQFGYTQSLAPDLLELDFSPKTGEIKRVKAVEND